MRPGSRVLHACQTFPHVSVLSFLMSLALSCFKRLLLVCSLYRFPSLVFRGWTGHFHLVSYPICCYLCPGLHVHGHVWHISLLASYVALFVHLGVVEPVWTFLFCSKAQLLPGWWLCVLCIPTNLSVWKTRCTVQHSVLLLSEYRGTFTRAMQKRGKNMELCLKCILIANGALEL